MCQDLGQALYMCYPIRSSQGVEVDTMEHCAQCRDEITFSRSHSYEVAEWDLGFEMGSEIQH